MPTTLASEILHLLERNGEMQRIDLYRASPVLLASFTFSLERAKKKGYRYPICTAPENALMKLLKDGVIERTGRGRYKLKEATDGDSAR